MTRNMKKEQQWVIQTKDAREVIVSTPSYSEEGFLVNTCIIDILVLAARIKRALPVGKRVA